MVKYIGFHLLPWVLLPMVPRNNQIRGTVLKQNIVGEKSDIEKFCVHRRSYSNVVKELDVFVRAMGVQW